MKSRLSKQEMHKACLIITALFLVFFVSMIVAIPASAAIIDQAEYFFDTDPGESLGNPLTITPGGGPGIPLNVEFSGISTSGLSVGHHLLFMRFRGSDGNWGPARQYGVNIKAPASIIDTAEVFVDTDPGQGYGTTILTPMDGNYDEWQESLEKTINTTGWTTGPHTVYVRARNSLGVWGLESPVFSNTASNVNVTGDKWVARAEYFFDVDPGEGFALPLTLYSPGGIGMPAYVNLAGIPIKGLTSGQHTLYVRAQDSEGMWGPARHIYFNVIPTAFTLSGAEFFIDTDPGAGSGIPVVTPYDGTYDEGSELITGQFNTAGLTHVEHTLCLRAKDNQNKWSTVPVDLTYPWCTKFTVQGVKAVVAGTVTEEGTGLPLNGVRISSDDGGEAYSSFDGTYSLVVAEGNRTLSINTGGYQPVQESLNVAAPVTQHSFTLIKSEQPFGPQKNQGMFAEPVNTATGNYFFNHTDLKVSAPGIPFEFSRYYNAQDLTHSIIGFGWSNNLDVRIYQGKDLIIVKYGDGHEERYQPDGYGGYTTQPGNYTKLSLTNGAYELLTKGQVRYRFSSSGRLISIEDRNGNALTINRSVDDRITSVVEPAGRIYTFDYNPSGNLSSITDPIGRIIRYVVDDQRNLTAVTDANGNTTKYTYDSHHLLLTVMDPRSNFIVSNTYDGLRRIVNLQKDAKGNTVTFAYDPLSRTTTITDPLFGVTKHIYDNHLRLVEEVCPLNYSTKYTYDSNHNRIEVVDKNGNKTTYSYDPMGNVTSKTDALNFVTNITYDANNNPLARTEAVGTPLQRTTTFEYDAKGNLLKTTDALGGITEFTYDAYGQPLAIKDPRGNTATNKYDPQGNLIEMTDALGNKTTYTYDGVGRRITSTDALLRTTTFTYDNNNNVLTVTDPIGTLTYTYDKNNNRTSIKDKKGKTTQYSYDVKDLLTTITDPLSNSIINTYDALDRKNFIKDKNGNITGFAYNATGNLVEVSDPRGKKTAYTYDPNGNRLTETDPLLHTTTYKYDALNRLAEMKDSLGNATTTVYDELGRVKSTINAIGQIMAFEYDLLDRLKKVTDANGGIVTYTYDANGNRLTMTDPNGNTTTYQYDALNRLEIKTEPLGGKYQYVYDVVGNMTSITDPNGDTKTYTYDGLNRLIKTIYPDTTSDIFSYDANSNRISMTDMLGTSIYTYDDLNRMTTYTDPFGKTVGYGYDNNGNRTSLTYPDGKIVNYAYDEINRLETVTDWLGRTTTYAYNDTDKLTGILNPNNTRVAIAYDNADRLTGLSNTKSDSTVISSYSYTLDAIGNHGNVVANEPLIPLIPSSNVGYTYDAENRMTDAGGIANSFDPNGNMTAKGSDTFAYDYNNRLEQSTISGVVTQYRYDGVGNRRVKNENGLVTRYILDINGSLSNVIAETDVNGTITAYYVYGLGLISKVLPDGSAFYYHYDSRGSTIALTDSMENITDAYSYDPFGNVINRVSPTPNPFRYVGKYGVMDEGNRLQYIRARYYSPELGRFITKDPLTGKDEDCQSLNRYVYALNNPVVLLDISGLSTKDTGDKSQYIKMLADFTMRYATKTSEEAMKAGLKLWANNIADNWFRESLMMSNSWDIYGMSGATKFAVNKGLPVLDVLSGGVIQYYEDSNSGIDPMERAARISLTVSVKAMTSAGKLIPGVTPLAIAADVAYDMNRDVYFSEFKNVVNKVMDKPTDWLGLKFYQWGWY